MNPPRPKHARIEALATELRLPTVRRQHAELAQRMAEQGGDYSAYLAELLGQEVSDRLARRIQRRIKSARFPQVKLLGEIDFSAEPMPPREQLETLATCDFIDEGRNIIALGPSGTGKTHVALALAYAACQRGLSVRFYTAANLAADLQAAHDKHLLHRFLPRFARWDLVILDELGYLPLGTTGAELLFQALSERHERRSIIVTSNLPFSEWTEVFHTERLTAAILDRLTDRAIILQLNGPSFRLRRSLAASPTNSATPVTSPEPESEPPQPDRTPSEIAEKGQGT